MGKFFHKKEKDNFFENLENDVMNEYTKNTAQHTVRADALTADEVNSENMRVDFKGGDSSNPLDALKKRMQSSQKQTPVSVSAPATDGELQSKSTLLERCRPYTLDDEGHDLSKENHPLYKLESVAEILKSDSEKALEALSKKYNLTVDDYTGKNAVPPVTKPAENEVPEKDSSVPTFKEMVEASKNADTDALVFEEVLAQNSNVSITEIHTNLPDISDIDNLQKFPQADTASQSDTATIRFTPIKDDDSGTGHISVSSTTRPIDISSDLEGFEEITQGAPSNTELQQTEFEDYESRDEYDSPEKAKALIRKLSLSKRSAFIRIIPSLFSVLTLVFFFFGSLNDLIIKEPKTMIVICGCLYAISFIANCDMFLSVKHLFSKKCSTDVFALFTSLSTVALAVSRILSSGDENAIPIFGLIFLASVILLIRAITAFWNISTLLGNLKQITTSKPKKAVTLITDYATNFAMAKNSIEGDVLTATPIQTDFVADFMKYSNYGVKLKGKLRALFFTVLTVATVFGIAGKLYYDSSVLAFYCSACIFCIAAMPVLFLIDTLPLRSAAKKLNKKGAMIAGKTAAERLEMANAAVLSSADIFPSGTVTLQSIKVLSENNFDDIIMRAASLTEAVNSTLAPIFKQIAKTNDAYELPDSATVKYEERLGLSGWVDNELLFIGNRTLMEAHGIEVPGIEVDRQILRKGFFPVYLACEGKACALIIVQYLISPEIAIDLKYLTNLGVTLLINNTDPNINENMICDYFGLHDDSVKVMSNAGAHMYRNAVLPTEKCSAPAAFRGSPATFITIMNCASKIKKSNFLISATYILTAILGIIAFVYSALSGNTNLPSSTLILAYESAVLLITILLYLFKKP